MNWKTTAALGALLAAALGYYFLKAPPGGSTAAGPGSPQGNRLFPELIGDRVTRIDVLRKGETVTRIERATDAVGDFWRIAPPVDKPAEPLAVRDMVVAVDRFVKSGGMEPGKPETAPAVTGLDDPRLIVTFHGPGQKETVRFGKQAPANSVAVFFQKEGDPKIYLATQEVLAAFDKPAVALRQKQLLRFNPHRVVKAEVVHKFERVKQGQPKTVEFERALLEHAESGERGWWLIEPQREKLEDLKVMQLVTDLAALPIEDWRPAGNLNEQGFDQPWDKASLWLFGADKPMTVLFGNLDDSKQRRFVHVEGSGEVARVDVNRCDKLPFELNHFRPVIVFTFSRDAVKSFRLDSSDGAKVEIERREKKNGQTGVTTATWEVVEPKGVKVDKDRIDGFVGTALGMSIVPRGFLGKQDLKLAHLDPPDLWVTVETYDGKKHVRGLSATSAGGYMRREGLDEVFEVQKEIVQILKRLELNFLHPEVFNVPRESLREFTFESKTGRSLEPVYYAVRFDAGKGKWLYAKPQDLAGKEPNESLMSGILAVMNYVQAASFIGRDAATAKEYGLTEAAAPSRLKVVYDGGEVVFLFSKDQSDKPTRPIYFARRQDSPVVFQISSPFVQSLKELTEK